MKTIHVKGMSCQHCVKAVIKALSEIEGVGEVNVDLATGRVSIVENSPVDDQVLRERIVKAGYEMG